MRFRAAFAVAALAGLIVGLGASPVSAMRAPTGLDRASTSASEPARRFWTNDKHHYRSPWYAGAHRKMIPWGCTRAPYYPPSPQCTDDRGFHHGFDIAMRCGVNLYAGYRGRVVKPKSSGALGPAYGSKAFRLRNYSVDKDFVIGHVRRVYVKPGQWAHKGQLIARAGALGAPDGCHLHFEVRRKGQQYYEAVDPRPYLQLRR